MVENFEVSEDVSGYDVLFLMLSQTGQHKSLQLFRNSEILHEAANSGRSFVVKGFTSFYLEVTKHPNGVIKKQIKYLSST